MVTAAAYKRYQERKGRPTAEDEEKGVHALLDEIAKMRGYKEKLIGKKKISPIVQYADFLLEKNLKFDIIKKGAQYYDRNAGEYRIADKDVSRLEQYIQLLREQKVQGYVSIRKYNDLLARQEGYKYLIEEEKRKAGVSGLPVSIYRDKIAKEEGFASYEELCDALAKKEGFASCEQYNDALALREGRKLIRYREERKAAELGLFSIEEYYEYLAKERGFDSHEEYLNYLESMNAIRSTYTTLIPKKDFDDVFKLIKDKWIAEHEKFIAFCNEFWKDSLGPYFEKTGKDEAVVITEDVTKELDIFHHSRPGSLGIYSIDDIIIGMTYVLEDKNVDVILSKDGKTITLKKRKIEMGRDIKLETK